MVTGVACGLQNRYGAFARPGWVRFPHVPATPSRLPAAVLALVASLSAVGSAAAQDPQAGPATPDSLSARADTIPPISPLGAFGRSMILPGWGQVEVGRPERGAIYFGAAAASLGMVFKSQSKLSAARAIEPEDQELVASRTRQRENWIVMSVFIAFVSGLDAWVSTHFWDFEATLDAPPEGTVRGSVGLKVKLP